jgi:hypothetical protein
MRQFQFIFQNWNWRFFVKVKNVLIFCMLANCYYSCFLCLLFSYHLFMGCKKLGVLLLCKLPSPIVVMSTCYDHLERYALSFFVVGGSSAGSRTKTKLLAPLLKQHPRLNPSLEMAKERRHLLVP